MTIASRLFLTSFPILINLYARMYKDADELLAFPPEPKDFNLPVQEFFDFVIGKFIHAHLKKIPPFPDY